MFKSIVVPVDTADIALARLAIDSAVKLADPGHSMLTLIHVVPVMPVAMMDTMPISLEGEIAEQARATLADLARDIDLPGGQITVVVRIGGVYHEVLAIAEEQRADLIVIGSHQPSVATYLFGSDASSIVSQAPCSVMVTREAKPVEVAETADAETTKNFSSVDAAVQAAQQAE